MISEDIKPEEKTQKNNIFGYGRTSKETEGKKRAVAKKSRA